MSGNPGLSFNNLMSGVVMVWVGGEFEYRPLTIYNTIPSNKSVPWVGGNPLHNYLDIHNVIPYTL